MCSFTDSLKEDTIFDRKYSEWCLEMARRDLKSAKEQKDDLDVSGYVENIRSWAEIADVSFADLGTSEDELKQLVQTGYESEARTCLEMAQGMYGHSRLHLYVRTMRNVGRSFLREPKFRWFKLFLAAVFCLLPRYTRQHYIALMREYLAKDRRQLRGTI